MGIAQRSGRYNAEFWWVCILQRFWWSYCRGLVGVVQRFGEYSERSGGKIAEI